MSAVQTSEAHPPSEGKQRRTVMACSNCRRRKIRCVTTERPPIHPCERCTRRCLTCEFVRVTDQPRRSSSASPASDAFFVPDPPQSGPSRTSPTWTPPVNIGAPSFPRGFGTPSRLPYTGPPPLNRSSQSYRPSIPGSNEPSMPPGALTPYTDFLSSNRGLPDSRCPIPPGYQHFTDTRYVQPGSPQISIVPGPYAPPHHTTPPHRPPSVLNQRSDLQAGRYVSAQPPDLYREYPFDARDRELPFADGAPDYEWPQGPSRSSLLIPSRFRV
ncbi:hypothetical protein DFH09DRAFT_1311792 [Mycena vulgaris]|nr:hypothetical protein DFH09DRAFT_1311792 [Mycena vulgaris]